MAVTIIDKKHICGTVYDAKNGLLIIILILPSVLQSAG